MTTTNMVEDAKLENYYGIVSSQIVAGTGFFSDLAAGFSDFFGGRSGSYRNQLESLYDEALDELSYKGSVLGANAIIGLRIDLDNISGKGMSMFMITAVGTAVNVKFKDDSVIQNVSNTINVDTLINAVNKKAILSKLEEKRLLSSEEWDTIIKNPDNDYVIPLTELYYETILVPEKYAIEMGTEFRKKYALFIKMADRKLAAKALYKGLKTDSILSATVLLVNDGFFDAPSILDVLKEGYLDRAISLLEGKQPTYSENDLKDMIGLEEALDNLPDTGKIEMVKGGVFSKDSEKFICHCGEKNDPDKEYCIYCGRNIKGLRQSQVLAIEAYKTRVHTLKELLNKQ